MKSFVLIPFACAVLLFAFGPSAERNDLRFEVDLDGRPIGTYTVNRTAIGERETFTVEMETTAGLIGRITHRSILKSSFERNRLVLSEFKTWINSELESSATIRFSEGKYVRQEGARLTEICSDLVEFSSASLFFKEPIGRKTIFLENYSCEIPISHAAQNQYEVKLPNGGVERYVYRDGTLVEMKQINSFATITVRAN